MPIYLDVSSSSPLGPKFDWLEPFNVLTVEKHVSNDGRLGEDSGGEYNCFHEKIQLEIILSGLSEQSM